MRNTESVNQRLFNTLHQELKSYRDNFLRDSLQKPFIRDLDRAVRRSHEPRLANAVRGAAADTKQSVVTQWCGNLENAIHSLLESCTAWK